MAKRWAKHQTSQEVAVGKITIKGVEVKIALTPVTGTILRVSIQPASEGAAPAERLDGPDLQPRDWQQPTAVLTETDNDGVQVGECTVSTAGDPTVLTVARRGRVIQRLAFDGDVTRFDLGDSRLYGLGQGFHSPMNRRGGIYDMAVNGQVSGIIDNGSVTTAIPYLIGSDGWGLFFHLPWKAVFDLNGGHWGAKPGGLDGICERAGGDVWDLFVVDGAESADAVTGYYEITGRAPLPPKYALGYQQSHRTLLYNKESFMRTCAAYFRESGFPCDMLIYLGTGFADDGWNVRHGSYDFNKRVFPNPAQDLAELQAEQFKIMLHVHDCPSTLHGMVSDEGVDPDDESHAANYWAKHQALLDGMPVEAWWPDGGDELGIEARLARHRMYQEGSLQQFPDARPLALHRNGYAGMTRWGGVIWSGDTLCEWKTLERQIQIGLNVAVSCSPYWCTDTGGFFSTKEYDGELYVRWFQYSAFCPLFRSHGRPSWLHAPFGWSRYKPSEVPSEHAKSAYAASRSEIDDSVAPDPRVEPVCRRFAELRYRMLPYLYTCAREAYDTGMPLMRPMWLAYGADRWYSGVGDQYMLGPSLLVAPVYTKSALARKVALPEGTWYGLLDGKTYQGGTHVVVDAPLDSMPVLVPAGAVIPMGDVMRYVGEEGHTDESGFEHLELAIYTGADAEYTLYEDDGRSMAYEKEVCTRTTFRWDNAQRRVTAEGVSSTHAGKMRRLKGVLYPGGKAIELICRY
jgi:alpha-glucosidase/alpha-D-xyloside xylohydrolase